MIGSWVWESAELVGREGWKEAEGNSGENKDRKTRMVVH